MDTVIPDPQTTQAVYDRQAARFAADRGPLEETWLKRFTSHLPKGAMVLDLGCGTGQPIGDWLSASGYHVVGADFSAQMLARARKRVPQGDWRLQDMRALDMAERFDGIIAWHSFFHLTAPEQSATLLRIARHLKLGGVFLTTVGPEGGEVGGTVGGDPVYHASLTPDEYATRLRECGMRLRAFVAEDPDAGGATVLMARKVAP